MGYYTAINNDFLRNKKLTLQQKGLLGLMATHSDEFKFHIRWLAEQGGVNKNTVSNWIRELADLGYVEVVQPRDSSNRFTGSYIKLNRDEIVHLGKLNNNKAISEINESVAGATNSVQCKEPEIDEGDERWSPF